METKHKLDAKIKALDAQIDAIQKQLNDLQAKRSADIRAAHKFTAADYRIRIVGDVNHTFDIDDVCGDAPTADDTPKFKRAYTKWQEALDDGLIEAYGFILEERDPETEEWNETDSCFGYYYNTSERWTTFEKMIVREAAANLPDGIKVKLVEIVVGE